MTSQTVPNPQPIYLVPSSPKTGMGMHQASLGYVGRSGRRQWEA